MLSSGSGSRRQSGSLREPCATFALTAAKLLHQLYKKVGFVMSMENPSHAKGYPPSAVASIKSKETATTRTAAAVSYEASKQQSSISAARNGTGVALSSDQYLHCIRPTTGSNESLLSPGDILTRLKITSADSAKWMRRIFKKHGVPYVLVCGKIRATETQYCVLLERITCSPSADTEGDEFRTHDARPHRAEGGSPSKSSVDERVTQMLGRT